MPKIILSPFSCIQRFRKWLNGSMTVHHYLFIILLVIILLGSPYYIHQSIRSIMWTNRAVTGVSVLGLSNPLPGSNLLNDEMRKNDLESTYQQAVQQIQPPVQQIQSAVQLVAPAVITSYTLSGTASFTPVIPGTPIVADIQADIYVNGVYNNETYIAVSTKGKLEKGAITGGTSFTLDPSKSESAAIILRSINSEATFSGVRLIKNESPNINLLNTEIQQNHLTSGSNEVFQPIGPAATTTYTLSGTSSFTPVIPGIGYPMVADIQADIYNNKGEYERTSTAISTRDKLGGGTTGGGSLSGSTSFTLDASKGESAAIILRSINSQAHFSNVSLNEQTITNQLASPVATITPSLILTTHATPTPTTRPKPKPKLTFIPKTITTLQSTPTPTIQPKPTSISPVTPIPVITAVSKNPVSNIIGQYIQSVASQPLVVNTGFRVTSIIRDTIFVIRNIILFWRPQPTITSITESESPRYGFVPVGSGDIPTEITKLNTNQYYTYDYNGPKGTRAAYMVAKHLWNNTDPSTLKLLMDDNLSNFEFEGSDGDPILSWSVWNNGGSRNSGYAKISTYRSVNGNSSAYVYNGPANIGTLISQRYNKSVTPGQKIIYGVWVYTAYPSDISIQFQNADPPYNEIEFGTTALDQPQANKWTFVTGYGIVPAGVTNFNFYLRVGYPPDHAKQADAWFDGAAVYVVDAPSSQMQTLVNEKGAGATWFIGNEPGFESSTVMEEPTSTKWIYPVTADFYALLYRSFYTLIKRYDPSAVILPGGLAGAPCPFDIDHDGVPGVSGDFCGPPPGIHYRPKLFLDSWRFSSNKFFGSQPLIDAMNIHYYETDSYHNQWGGAGGLAAYLTLLKNYMDITVPGSAWAGKPIWISEFGVSKDAPSDGAPGGGVDFTREATKFLLSNTLNIQKWFWFDTCGFDPNLAPLFVSLSPGGCTPDLMLSPAGVMYANQAPTPTILPLPTATPKPPPPPPPTGGPTPTPSTLPIAGHVRDSQTKAPIAGVKVMVCKSNGSGCAYPITDSDGHFSAAGLVNLNDWYDVYLAEGVFVPGDPPLGYQLPPKTTTPNYDWNFSRNPGLPWEPGYDPILPWGDQPVGSLFYQSQKLGSSDCAGSNGDRQDGRCDFVYDPPQIAGYVQDSKTGNGISGVTVTIYNGAPSDNTRTVTTDDSGYYRLSTTGFIDRDWDYIVSIVGTSPIGYQLPAKPVGGDTTWVFKNGIALGRNTNPNPPDNDWTYDQRFQSADCAGQNPYDGNKTGRCDFTFDPSDKIPDKILLMIAKIAKIKNKIPVISTIRDAIPFLKPQSTITPIPALSDNLSKYDLNNDNKIGANDYGILLSVIQKVNKHQSLTAAEKRADFNGDGLINMVDYILFKKHFK